MVMQDLTKFLVTGVLLGFVLAMAVFRPGILSEEHKGEAPPVPTASPTPGTKDSAGQALVGQEPHDSCSGEEQYERELDERERALDERDRKLDARDEKQDERKIHLDDWEKDLNEREHQLDEREKRVEEKENQLRREKKDLDEGWAALRKGQAGLAEEEEALKRLRRWTETALVLTGLLAVPSLLVLALLVRNELQA